MSYPKFARSCLPPCCLHTHVLHAGLRGNLGPHVGPTAPLGCSSSLNRGMVSAGPALALQRLDLGHVLGTYLFGLQAQAQSSHAAALRELEYEASWRACRWQVGMLSVWIPLTRSQTPLYIYMPVLISSPVYIPLYRASTSLPIAWEALVV